MLNHVYTILTELPKDADGIVYFDTPVKVKTTGAFPDVHLWGAYPSPSGDVQVMDVEREWHTLQATEKDAQAIEALFQRVRFMKQQYLAKLQEAHL